MNADFSRLHAIALGIGWNRIYRLVIVHHAILHLTDLVHYDEYHRLFWTRLNHSAALSEQTGLNGQGGHLASRDDKT